MTQIRHLPAPASDHSRQQQVFNIQPVICQTEFPRQFLVPRLSLVPDLAMELGQLQLCLRSVVRAFLLAGQGTVRSLQFRQGSFQRLRCLVRYPIAAREEYFQAEVQTSGFTRLDSVYWLILTVYDKIHKQVSAGIPLDRHSFDRAINLTGLRKLVHRFPDLELVVFQQLPPGLGQREGLRIEQSISVVVSPLPLGEVGLSGPGEGSGGTGRPRTNDGPSPSPAAETATSPRGRGD